jgi:hypothetical protein
VKLPTVILLRFYKIMKPWTSENMKKALKYFKVSGICLLNTLIAEGKATKLGSWSNRISHCNKCCYSPWSSGGHIRHWISCELHNVQLLHNSCIVPGWRARVSSAYLVAGYGAGQPEFDFRQSMTFLFSTASIPNLEPTESHIQWERREGAWKGFSQW